jgi:VPDSG-CTERM motif
MNKKLIATIALACASSAHAHMVELTPGGFNWNNQPKVVSDWYETKRQFQTLYDPSLFNVTGLGTSTITLSWNLANVGYFQYLFVEYRQDHDNVFANFYQVTLHEWRQGQATVTVNGTFPVTFFNAFGHRDVPDAGSTFILFGLSLLGLFYARH